MRRIITVMAIAAILSVFALLRGFGTASVVIDNPASHGQPPTLRLVAAALEPVPGSPAPSPTSAVRVSTKEEVQKEPTTDIARTQGDTAPSALIVPLSERDVLQLQPTTMTEKLSQVHPTCVGEGALREIGADAKRHGGKGAVAKDLERYAYGKGNCFKNCGGNLIPGEPRLRGTQVSADRVVYFQGEFYQVVEDAQPAGTKKGGAKRTVRFNGYFPMISGVWPQRVTNHVVLKSMSKAQLAKLVAEQRKGGAVRVPSAYFQPASDYLSTYHTPVETVLTTFHTLLDKISPSPCDVVRGSPVAPTFVVTSRPRTSLYGFKKNSCHLEDDEVKATLRGRKGGAARNQCMKGTWGTMYTAMIGGSDNVYGLDAAEWQFDSPDRGPKDALNIGELSGKTAVGPQLILFDTIRFGNPSNCEPLWGADPFYAEALAQRQPALNISRAAKGNVEDVKALPFPNSTFEEFTTSYGECQRALWRFRSFYIARSLKEVGGIGWDGAKTMLVGPVATQAKAPVRVLFTSRKGDWARYITNEDAVVAYLKNHVRRTYGDGSDVIVLKWSGPLSQQIDRLRKEGITVYVANHGANLLNSVFLPPNAGVVTMSIAEPGFYPFSVFPSWLHWRNLLIEQDCNRRLYKGKCKWSLGHNNDNRVSDAQLIMLTDAVDDIIAAQRRHPYRSGMEDLSQCSSRW